MFQPWSISAQIVAKYLKSDPNNGLTGAEAQNRLKKYGANRIPAKKKFSGVKYIVFVCAAISIVSWISFFFGNLYFLYYVVFGIICAAITLVVDQQTSQLIENRTQENLSETLVIREGKRCSISSQDLVIGDLVYLPRAAAAPAEGRVIVAVDPERERYSAKNGSVRFAVTVEALEAETPVDQRTNMILTGDIILSGHVVFMVTETCQKARIPTRIIKTESFYSHLVNSLPAWLWGVLLLAFVLRWVVSITNLLVDGLLLTATILSYWFIKKIQVILTTYRLANHSVLVKNGDVLDLSANMRVLLSDKTGTLTAETMQVQLLCTGDTFSRFPHTDLSYSNLIPYLRVCRLNANNWGSTEIALVEWAEKLKHIPLTLVSRERVFEYEFNYNARRMTTINLAQNCRYYIAVKGSAEHVLPLCETCMIDSIVEPFSPLLREQVQENIHAMTSQGLRIVALAERWTDEEGIVQERAQAEQSLTFIGLMGLTNPLRDDIGRSIEMLSEAGVTTMIMSGDDPVTTFSIAKQAQVVSDKAILVESVLVGSELSQHPGFTQEAFRIFARVTPENKLEILGRLKQDAGYVVGMIGDSSNDRATMLKCDVAFAPHYGRDAVLQIADVLLLKNPFDGIRAMVQTARQMVERNTFLRLAFVNNLILMAFGSIYLRARFGSTISVSSWGMLWGAGLLLALITLLAWQNQAMHTKRNVFLRLLTLVGLLIVGFELIRTYQIPLLLSMSLQTVESFLFKIQHE